ncbi:two-component system, response regulator YesN [Paenibacillus catalpae]|uniref:Two-component system, response regulator YesN n=1 Tax=Paenibacillus catalpae TaxID=1045775 RepID=A0A1I2CTV5_9BACL|nr:helix-turn-helix domain-containing protein [Paenibacillus catalpae]SFE71602.1 two-component system, response regulator YesN [Paenibacillus catalpae]
MIRVLIVDDEIYAVKGLRSGVRWELIGVDEVYEAYHAPMAQQVLLEQPIDIVICDIEMPEISGLELMEWVKSRGMKPETIVLTCHSEFEYAKRAIHLGSFEYLLKPVVYTELEETLLTAISRVKEKRRINETDEQYNKIVELWNSRKPMLVERFWQDLLERRVSTSPEAIRQSLFTYDMRMSAVERVRLILISVESWERPLNERDELIMEFALRKSAEEMLLEKLSGNVIQDHRGNIMVVLHLGEVDAVREEIETLCRNYAEACSRYFYCRLSCYIGELTAVNDVLQSYLTLLNKEYRNVSMAGGIIWSEDPADTKVKTAAPFTESMLDWADLLEQGAVTELALRLEEWTDAIDPRTTTVDSLTASCHALLQVIYYAMHRKGLQAQQLYENHRCSGVETATRSVGQFKTWVRCIAGAAGSLFTRTMAVSPIVQKVKAYIDEHLNEELSREQLASIAFVNPAYLSRLFRKETGMVLTDYILKERMDRAAELLSTTDRSISEIADGLSYGNFSYFARLFRKVHGVTPQEYRKPYRR